jgi:hypothetical protein
MTELSPQAEAILNAVTFTRYDAPYFACPKSIDQIRLEAAGVLRAAADGVVPDEGHTLPIHHPSAEWFRFDERKKARAAFLAIAAELEAQP